MAEGEVAGRKVIEQRVGDLALALTAPDALMAAVRGHLYIESEVQYFLDRQLIRSSELPSKLDYELRLAIALALGLPAPLGGALKKIGWLRNQFAHNLDFELTKQICDSLYQALGTPLQNYAKDFYAVHKGKLWILGGDVAQQVAGLKAQPGRDFALFGSANLAATLWRHGLIDELRLLTTPRLVGAGTPLFAVPSQPAALRLVRAESWPSGTTLSVYRKV